MIYDCRWSSDIDSVFFNNFINTFNAIFNKCLDYSYFENKYLNNRYGESVLVIAYCNKCPVAVDALWRNDVNGQMSFQSVDTGVLPLYRGHGIFYGMVREKISKLKDGALVYGFPNNNSYKGFLNIGWNLQKEYWQRILFNPNAIDNNVQYPYIDEEYFKWWLNKNSANYAYVKYFGRLFIVAKRYRFPIYTIVGRCNNWVSNYLPKVRGIYMLCYKSDKKCIYSGLFTVTRVITLNNPNKMVPLWKLDAL